MSSNNYSAPQAPALARSIALPRALARWSDIAIVVTLLLAPFGVFLGPALVRGVFFLHDVQYYFYPYHALPAALLGQGELPLWNPYAFSGIPLLGDGQTAMFYPPNWLFFVLPGAAALNYDILIQFSIAGASTYLFARSLGLWRMPALVGAIAFEFCGFLTARVVHLSILSGAALLPLAFLCVDRALRLGSKRWFAAAAGAVALQALAGHPQVPVYTALALGLYALVRAAERWRGDRDWRWLVRLPLRLAGIYLLGYGLAAIQLAPWIELGTLSPRAAGASFDFVFGGSMSGSNWLLFLFPYLYGSLGSGPYGTQGLDIPNAVKLWEHSGYVGVLPLALAAYALLGLLSWAAEQISGLKPARRMEDKQTSRQADQERPSPANLLVSWSPSLPVAVLFFGLLLLGGLVLAAGRYTPFAGLIYILPVIGKLRDVERGLVLVAFALALLAAYGLQRIVEAPRLPRTSLLALALVVVWLPQLVVALGGQAWFQRAMNLRPAEIANLQLGRPNAAVPAALGLLAAALLLWWSRRPAGAASQALALALVAADLGGYAAFFNPTSNPQIFRQPPGVLAAFDAVGAPFRKATWLDTNDLDTRTAQETLAVSWSMAYGIQDINGFNSLQPRRYTDYLFGPQVGDVSYGRLNDPRLLRPESPILNALGVKYLLVPAKQQPALGSNFHQVYANTQVRVYANKAAYPRAFFADAVRATTDQQAVLRTVTADGFDGRRTALVETDRPPELAPAGGPASASITEYRANRVTISANTDAPRLLVLGDMYFPGWRALVDGAPAPIYRTNYLFRGVVVPAGQHTVTFEYRPVSALLGAAISGLALLVVGWLVFGRAGRMLAGHRFG